MSLFDSPIGFAGERKAFAMLVLTFYAALYGLLSLLFYMAPPDQPEVRAWVPAFLALACTYGLSFFALGADWFFARWFAIGLGYSGVTVAVWGMASSQTIDKVLLFYGVTHGLVVLCLQGQKLTAHFDGQPDWRKLLRVSDEQGVEKIRHSVTRAAASLPTLILFALAPRESQGLWLLLVGTGLFAILRNRTAGVVLLFTAAIGLPVSLLHTHKDIWATGLGPMDALFAPTQTHAFGLLCSALLFAAVLPYARPVLNYLRGRAA